MKWKSKKTSQGFQHGDVRYRGRFLLFPKCLNGECRWLEFAIIKQKYTSNNYYFGWDDVEFMKNPKQKKYTNY
jgi:hypothetical protein